MTSSPARQILHRFVVAAPVNGSAVANPDGTVTFTPTTGFNGTASFSYTVKDTLAQTSNFAGVTITVLPTPPIASNDSASTAYNTPVTVTVLVNDTFAGTPDPTSIAVSASVNGTIVANANGTITFTPTTNFSGAASFSYTVNDTLAQASNSATASITVLPPPPPPAPAVAWLNAQLYPTKCIKLWWPTVALPGAGFSITEIFNGVVNPTPITGPFLTSGTLTYIIMTGKPSGTYSYTIRTTAAGYSNSPATSVSAATTIP